MSHAERLSNLVSSNQIKTRAGEEVVRDAVDHLEAVEQELALISGLLTGEGTPAERVEKLVIDSLDMKRRLAEKAGDFLRNLGGYHA